jgi:thiol-disulfide isomerase/thioredoxin
MSNSKKNVAWLFLAAAIIVVLILFVITLLRARPKPPLNEIIKSRQTWNVAYGSWGGKPAPDLAFRDINGAPHSLREYRGKTVMLVFWATWCPPCNEEIPSLKKLASDSAGQLTILALTFEDPNVVKPFVAEKGLNYTVLAAPPESLPTPYRDVQGFPTTFYIDANGIIRLTAEGLVTGPESRDILAAIQPTAPPR